MIFSGRTFFQNAANGLKHKMVNMDLPISLGISLMLIFSIMGTINPFNLFEGKVYYDSISMFIFLLLSSRYLEQKIKTKSWETFSKIFKKLPESARKVTNLDWQNAETALVGISDVGVGDVIQILPGETIPFDGEIISGKTHLNESFMTGESFPVSRSSGNHILAGAINIDGLIYVRVERIRISSYIYKIRKLIKDAQSTKPAIIRIIDKIAQPFLISIIILSIGSALFWWAQSSQTAINAMISVLIVTCPCALYLSAPIAMISASNKLAKMGIYTKNLDALERLEKINTIFFDKTGTLTNLNPMIHKAFFSEKYDKKMIMGIICQLTNKSLHPFSRELARRFNSINGAFIDNIREIPGQGLSAHSDSLGSLQLGSNRFCKLNQFDLSKSIRDAQVHLVCHGEWLASFSFKENIKRNVTKVITDLIANNINLVILSGDNKIAVKNIAKKLNIINSFWCLTPKMKHKKIINAQSAGENVLMVGDGFNDGPALAQANVSIAMGDSPSIIQTESDFIIINNDIKSIKLLINFSKRTMFIVKENIVWALLYNCIMIPFAFLGMIEPWFAGLGMAISSLIVALNSYRLIF
jgi:Cu2+-exporting ATPase